MEQIQEYFRRIVSKEAYGFFAVFSRFEYAMKKSGMIKNGTFASWSQLGECLPNDFFKAVRDNDATDILFTDPPRLLIPLLEIGRKSVQFEERGTPPKGLNQLFDGLKTIRNNLLHGDKHHDDRRDQKLIVAALVVLNMVYEAAHKSEDGLRFVADLDYGLKQMLPDTECEGERA